MEREAAPVVDLSSLGSTSCGVWTRRQAVALTGAEGVRAQLREGAWQVLWPGTYADAGFGLSAEQWCWAAVLASGGDGQPFRSGSPDPVTGREPLRLRAVASGRTAARYWKLPLIDGDDPATGAREHRLDDVSVALHLPVLRSGDRRLHRRRHRLGRADLARTSSGVVVMSVLRTLADLTGLLTMQAAVCAIDDALHRRLVTAEQLTAAVTAQAGRPGSARLSEAVALSDGRAESAHETLTRLLLLPALPGLEPQVRLRDSRGDVIARFDLGDPERRLAVESDGRAGHAGSAMVAKDRRRDARTEKHGWWTERVTWFEVRRLPDQTKARVLRRAALLDARWAA